MASTSSQPTRSPRTSQPQSQTSYQSQSISQSQSSSNGLRSQLRAPEASSGSQTITAAPPEPLPAGTLRLRGAPLPERERAHIRWAEDVVDNEGLGRKKSKVCCIWRPVRAPGESSDESSDSSDSESESDDDGDWKTRGRERGRHGHEHEHEHGEDCEHGSGGGGSGDAARAVGRRGTSPNAYEKMPKVKRRDKGSSTMTEIV